MANKSHRYLARLHRRFDGICHWCGQVTLLLPPVAKRKKLPPLMATRDHLDDRFSPERGRQPGTYRVVLACLKCNNERGAASQAAQPIEELQRRAQRKPLQEKWRAMRAQVPA